MTEKDDSAHNENDIHSLHIYHQLSWKLMMAMEKIMTETQKVDRNIPSVTSTLGSLSLSMPSLRGCNKIFHMLV